MPMTHDDLMRILEEGRLQPEAIHDLLAEYDSVVAERDRLRDGLERLQCGLRGGAALAASIMRDAESRREPKIGLEHLLEKAE